MNTKSKLVLSLSLGLLAAPFALMANTSEKSYVDAYRGRTDIPRPISVVTPSIDAEYAGQQLSIEFVVDVSGKPTLITSRTPEASKELVASVTAAVEQWKFAPALEAGQPVSRKVVLPINIVDTFAADNRFAAN